MQEVNDYDEMLFETGFPMLRDCYQILIITNWVFNKNLTVFCLLALPFREICSCFFTN